MRTVLPTDVVKCPIHADHCNNHHGPTRYAPCTCAQDGGALTFTEAHVQQAVCSPSRTSLLTSRRPDHTRVYDLNHHFRDVGLRGVTTLPEYFKLRGYASVGMGKIFHPVPDKVTGLVMY